MGRKKKEIIKIPTSITGKKQLLHKVMKEINKKNETQSLMFASALTAKTRVPFEIPELDELVGGGIVSGNYTIIWGGEGTGKSTSAYCLTASAQSTGKLVAYIDLEHKFSSERAKYFGVNLDELVLMTDIKNAEQAMDAIRVLAKTGAIDLIILDSIQAMSPKGEQETKKGQDKSLETDNIALLARKMGQFFDVCSNDIAKNNVAVLLIGQVRVGGIGTFYIHEHLSGGKALRHWAVQIVHIRKGQSCYSSDTRVLTNKGYKFYDEIQKNDLIPTVNMEKNCIEMKPVKHIYKYDVVNEPIYQFFNKQFEGFIVTPEHKLLTKKNINGFYNHNNYKIISAKHQIKKNRGYVFPISYPSGNKEYPIKDKELQFIAWCLTDGWIHKNKSTIQIYQSPKKYSERIKKLLWDLNIKFSKYIRKGGYCNTVWHVFNILKARQYAEKYMLTKDKQMPDWMFNLSDRQAAIFVDELIKGDGTYDYKNKKLWRKLTDGNKNNLEKLIGFLVTHNISVSHLYRYKNKNAWDLCFTCTPYRGYNKKEINYTGIVWGVEVENSLHFIERNGQFMITHNSDAPKITIKEGDKRIIKKIGFACVMKLEKTQTQSAPEGSEINIPFYYESGFKKKEKEVKKEEEEDESQN